MIDLGYRAQRLAYRLWGRLPAVAAPDAAPAGDGRQARALGAGDPLHQQADAGQAAQARPRARCSTSRTGDRADHPRPREDDRGFGGGVLLPGLRLGAPVLAGRPGHAGDALPRRRQCVLPPGYLCCGYPQTAAGQRDKGEQITTRNRVLFHRVANTLNYLDIKTVVVSCGTCMDQLQQYEFERHLPRLPAARHPRVPDGEGRRARRRRRRTLPVPRSLPHSDEDAPAAQGRQRSLVGAEVTLERALLRRVRHLRGHPARHRDPGPVPQGSGDAQGRAARHVPADSKATVKVLTSCPSCLQGLQRFDDDAGTDGRLHRGGDGAPPARRGTGCRSYVDRARHGGIERVLL